MGEEFLGVLVSGFWLELHEDQLRSAAQRADDEPGDPASGVRPGDFAGGGLCGVRVAQEWFEGGVEGGLGLGRDDDNLQDESAARDGVGPRGGGEDLFEFGVVVVGVEAERVLGHGTQFGVVAGVDESGVGRGEDVGGDEGEKGGGLVPAVGADICGDIAQRAAQRVGGQCGTHPFILPVSPRSGPGGVGCRFYQVGRAVTVRK